MRLLISEFICGGGMLHDPLSPSLKQEGLAMLQAVLRDCLHIEGLELLTTLDLRIELAQEITAAKAIEITTLQHNDDYRMVMQRLSQEADGVLLIAPESDSFLSDFIALLEDAQIRHFNSDSQSIEICADKLVCEQHLTAAGLTVVQSLSAIEIRQAVGAYIIKPRLGVGSEGLEIIQAEDLITRSIDLDQMLVQPLLQGKHASMSLLCWRGAARILSCNEQCFSQGISPRLQACRVNSESISTALDELASAIAKALPGLSGYVGVDYIETEQGIIVIEINPRLTSSYVGLSTALKENVAALCLQTFIQEQLPNEITRTDKVVEVVIG